MLFRTLHGENHIYSVPLFRLCVPSHLCPLYTHTDLSLDIKPVQFRSCEYISLPQALVRNGLFPTSPLQPRIAVSVDLLDFYFSIFERSADAVTALAGALKTMYRRRGFFILNAKVQTVSPNFPEFRN